MLQVWAMTAILVAVLIYAGSVLNATIREEAEKTRMMLRRALFDPEAGPEHLGHLWDANFMLEDVRRRMEERDA